jgi:hypothetical protein
MRKSHPSCPMQGQALMAVTMVSLASIFQQGWWQQATRAWGGGHFVGIDEAAQENVIICCRGWIHASKANHSDEDPVQSPFCCAAVSCLRMVMTDKDGEEDAAKFVRMPPASQGGLIQNGNNVLSLQTIG